MTTTKQRASVFVSPGNMKLGRVINVSLPPLITCRCDAPCRGKDCYALKAWRQYLNVRTAWRGNLAAYQTNADDYFDALVAKFKRSKTRMIRWHVGGDIPDPQYLQGMLRVARELPKKRFLCFTKRYEWVMNEQQIPKNLTFVFSAWPGLALPDDAAGRFGMAWMRSADEPDVRIPKDAVTCDGGCESCAKCWSLRAGQSVVFDKH